MITGKNIFGLIGITFLLTLAFLITTVRDSNDTTLDGLQGNLSEGIYMQLNNVSNNIKYKNPYNSNFSANDFIQNTIHVYFYGFIREAHTIIGVATNFIWKKVNYSTVRSTMWILSFIIGFWIVVKSIKPIALIYLLVDEYWKKKYKKDLNIWLKILIALVLFVVIILILLILLLMLNVIF